MTSMTSEPARAGGGPQLREALAENRRLVVGVALAAGAVGLAPLPLVGDLAIGLLRTSLVLRLARRRELELTREAAGVVAGWLHASSAPRLAAVTAVVAGLRLASGRFGRTLLVLFRFDDVGRTFLLGTYFDYYCLRYRPRGEVSISLARAEVIRRVIQLACATARPHLVSALFRKTVSDLVRAGTFVPRTVWNMALSVIEDRDSPALERVVEQDAGGFFAAVTRLVERELDATGEVTLGALCTAFDEAWAETGPSETPAAAIAHSAKQEQVDDHDDT